MRKEFVNSLNKKPQTRGSDDVEIVKKMSHSQIRQLKSLVKAIKSNRGIEDGKFKVTVNPIKEMEQYKERITQLTLPHRFGMYKTPTRGVPKTTEIELEDP